MMFHPRQERPTEPNAGIPRLEPGAHHPVHYHDFAQVWYMSNGWVVLRDPEGEGPNVSFSSTGAAPRATKLAAPRPLYQRP